ncbi:MULTISPECIES: PP2C family protein-serine/threonine phosphatase [unclassified Nocardiopsis]|uniref:PP2C family protein-serine/threonine phosphatase n=1 Tax=unclassified Nocardiopsis TaxID=2649073 RepID=UPI00135B175A|nr:MULTISPECIES: PP2C family protein-serine/threonine phosphatase [unclassified Nocardiopsis]
MAEGRGIDSVVSSLVVSSHQVPFEAIPKMVAAEATRAGMSDVRVYIADRQQLVLRELTGLGQGAHEGGEQLRIDGTLAGKAYVTGEPLRVTGRPQYWIPLLDGSERLGTLYVDHGTSSPDLRAMKLLASAVGILIADRRTNSDTYARLIRAQPMSVSAEMQWTLMPPSTFSNGRVTISAATEPAYDNAGDAFDYALSGDIAHLAVFDAMGHDNAAGLLANLAVGAFRNARRENTSLDETCRRVEAIMTEEFVRTRFVTAILAELNMDSGELAWISAGHMPPVLLRGGRALELECEPTHPLGMDLGLPVAVCHVQLEPGDRLLLYTDGIIEARDPQGREFGLEQFTDFIILHQAAQMSVPETLRRLVHSVMAHHHGKIDDDATVLFCEWHG